MLHKENFEAYGVDINYMHIDKTKQKHPQIEFKQADCGNKILFLITFLMLCGQVM